MLIFFLFQIHVVDEERQYASWTDDHELEEKEESSVGLKSGIIAAKRALNNLHSNLGREKFSQVSKILI